MLTELDGGRVRDIRTPGELLEPDLSGLGFDFGGDAVDFRHGPIDTKHRMTWQEEYGTSELRETVFAGSAGHMNLAARRRAHFIAWLESEGLNAKQVADHSRIPYTTLHSYVKGAATATKSLKGDTEAQIAAAYSLPVEAIFGGAVEGDGLANHVRAWRMERGVEIDALAQKIGVAVSTLEDLEAGKMAFSPSWRRRIADALGLPEGYMLLNPEDVPLEVMEMFSPQTPPAQRQRAKEMLRLLRTGTD